MFAALKQILGLSGTEVDFGELMRRGAQVVDVRSREEYSGGHVKGSVNVPLQNLESHLGKIAKNKPVITCCASGMRSASAKRILESKGFSEVVNGGGWRGLDQKLKP